MPKGIGYEFKKMGKGILDRARQALRGRKAMTTTRKKMKRRKGKGPAGEARDYKVNRKSPVGKLQERNKRMKEMMDD